MILYKNYIWFLCVYIYICVCVCVCVYVLFKLLKYVLLEGEKKISYSEKETNLEVRILPRN